MTADEDRAAREGRLRAGAQRVGKGQRPLKRQFADIGPIEARDTGGNCVCGPRRKAPAREHRRLAGVEGRHARLAHQRRADGGAHGASGKICRDGVDIGGLQVRGGRLAAHHALGERAPDRLRRHLRNHEPLRRAIETLLVARRASASVDLGAAPGDRRIERVRRRLVSIVIGWRGGSGGQGEARSGREQKPAGNDQSNDKPGRPHARFPV